MVVPSTLGVQTVRTTMTVLKDRLAASKSTRRSASKRLLCPCFGHSRELWFFGLLRTFLNGWTELAEASWACSWRWQRRPPPQPHQGHGGGALPSGMTALEVPPEPEGRQRGPHSGLRAAVKERHMRRLAVALTWTPPMMAALARSAWPPNQPPADALPRPYPRETPSEPSPWSEDADDPRNNSRAGNQGNRRCHGERAVSKHVSQATRLRPPGSKGGRWPGTCGPP
jgi:hypothetical protein